MDVNVVTSADPAQSKSQLLHQMLKVPKGDIASAALDCLKRPFWACHSNILIGSKSLRIKREAGCQSMRFGLK
jgi:hypothetical protein